jgi:putative aldouronate transport system permease protein
VSVFKKNLQNTNSTPAPGSSPSDSPWQPPTRSKWATLRREIWQYRYIYAMLALPLAFFIIFRYVPMYGIQLAFKEYSLRGIAESPWIGFGHFERMMIETDFFRALWNTLIISFQKIVFGFPFPIILAIMLNEVYMPRYKRFLQTVYTFPHFLSWIIVAGICLNLFGDAGAMKKIIEVMDPAMAKDWSFLYNNDTFRGFLVGTDIWKEAGWGTIIYLASIAGIDPALYEAATIDGCNRMQRIWYITLPGIASMIVIQFLLRVGGVMDGSFDQIFNLYSPPVYPSADTIDTFIYRITFQREVAVDMGFPTAVGLFKNVINFALLITANRVARIFGSDGII